MLRGTRGNFCENAITVEFNFSLEVFTKLKALAKSVSLLASSIFPTT